MIHEARLGKAMLDLARREGHKPMLPVSERPRKKHLKDMPRLADVIRYVIDHGAVERTREAAEDYCMSYNLFRQNLCRATKHGYLKCERIEKRQRRYTATDLAKRQIREIAK